MAEEKMYLELSESDGVSHKFYEVVVNGTQVSIRYGRIGDKGQTQAKTYPTPEKALTEANKKINEKLKKGYEHAAMGVRQKRPVTEKKSEVRSQKSEVKKWYPSETHPGNLRA